MSTKPATRIMATLGGLGAFAPNSTSCITSTPIAAPMCSWTLLGHEFKGVLGCDYFSAYRRFMKTFSIRVQFCLAHLIRDIKFLTQLPDARDRRYGEKLR